MAAGITEGYEGQRRQRGTHGDTHTHTLVHTNRYAHTHALTVHTVSASSSHSTCLHRQCHD